MGDSKAYQLCIDGKVWARMPEASEADVDKAVRAARRAGQGPESRWQGRCAAAGGGREAPSREIPALFVPYGAAPALDLVQAYGGGWQPAVNIAKAPS